MTEPTENPDPSSSEVAAAEPLPPRKVVLLSVIAATVVGGASLVGGKGTALGALLGAIILQMISNGLVILNIPQNYSQIVIGMVVIAAVLLDQFNAVLAKRRLLAKASSIKKEVVRSSDSHVSLKPKTT